MKKTLYLEFLSNRNIYFFILSCFIHFDLIGIGNSFDNSWKNVSAVTHNTDIRTVQNWLNRLPNGWNSPQSPDELVIQKRGRRKSIVWSPDFDTYKRRSLLRYNL